MKFFLLCSALSVLFVEFPHAFLQFGPEMPDESLYGPGRAVGQRAYRVALHLFANLPEHVDFFGSPVAVYKSVDHFVHPVDTY